MQQSTDTAETQNNAVTVAEDQTPARSALMHAFSEAEQVVSKLRTVPTDVDVRGSAGIYAVHLFFSRSAQGVLEFAQAFDAEVASSPSLHQAGVFLEARTRFQGIDVLAWTITEQAIPDDDPDEKHTVDQDPIAYALTDKADPAILDSPVATPAETGVSQ